MVRINNENMDEIGKKLGIQRKDLPRRKMNYFLYKILKFIFQFVIIVLLASMGLYIGDIIDQKSPLLTTPPNSFYPFSMSKSAIPIFAIPIIFLLSGLNSGNPEDSLQRSGLILKRKKGFLIIYLILSIITLSMSISTERYGIAILYSVSVNNEMNFKIH